METVACNGWKCLRLANDEVEVVITRDVGPRVIRFGYTGAANLFREMPGQQGGRGEAEWMIRGGHRFWVAPEAKPWSYETDNVPYAAAEAIAGGVRVRQEAGPVTGLAKEIAITLAPDRNEVTLVHTLTNAGATAVECAPWAPTTSSAWTFSRPILCAVGDCWGLASWRWRLPSPTAAAATRRATAISRRASAG